MGGSRWRKTSLARVISALLIGCALTAAPAHATPPDNDGFAAATTIAGLPFSAAVDLTEATTEPSEPFGCASIQGDVWYRLTAPGAEPIRVTLTTSDSQLWAAAYRDTGGGIGGLQSVNPCIYANQPAVISVAGGDTVYLQVNRGFYATVLTATLSVELVAPPANDAFVEAAAVSALPFESSVDTSGATVEAGEPSLCTPPASEKTVWYAYTPTVSQSVMATIYAPAPYGVAAYTGSSLAGLTQLGCQYGYPLAVQVHAGTTYYFQLGLPDGGGAQIGFKLDVAPPPVASFYFYPFEPSVFDSVSLSSQSYDPASSPLDQSWAFGDGSSANGPYQQHRYTADGDYQVTLTVTTADGRQASANQTVSVRTHDVAVLALDAPRFGKSGKAATITAAIGNTRYPESVQVQLLKNAAGGGWQLVGELVEPVPVMKPKKTTSFTFSYEFTAGDALAGKVTFQAVATIVGGPGDANPVDNVVVVPATVVTR
jgi:PKD repeat protein